MVRMTVGWQRGRHWQWWGRSGWKSIKQPLQVISRVFSRRQHFRCSLFLNITLSSPNLQTRGIVPSLLLSGQPFQSINWTRVRGKFLLPKQHLSEHMRPPKWMNRPLCLPFPFSPVLFFSFPHAAEEGGVLLRTVWVMREISGRDALEVGTLH